MKHMMNLIAGLFIGAGLILPGVSGGVLAIAFGIYDDLIFSLSHFFKNFKKNLIFLMPLFIGLGIGIIFFGKLLSSLFYKYPIPVKFAIMGLILGSLPILFSKLKKNSKDKIYNFKVIPFLIALGIGLTLYFLGNKTNLTDTTITGNMSDYIRLFVAGILYATGKIVPGISGSFLLMIIGLYEYILTILANPFAITRVDIINVLIFGFGFIAGLILLVKLVEKALIKKQYQTYSAIIGFVLGTIAIIYPGFTFDMTGLLAIALFIIMFIISYSFAKYEIKLHNKKIKA